jgi:hypothetical protein
LKVFWAFLQFGKIFLLLKIAKNHTDINPSTERCVKLFLLRTVVSDFYRQGCLFMSQTGKSASQTSGTPAFPVLMRLPDLRVPQVQPAVEQVEKILKETKPETEHVVEEPIAKPLAAPTVREEVVREEVVETSTTTPATKVSRHQRTQERQRRRESEGQQKKGSWWTSHFPVIAVGFLIALGVTLYLARQQRTAQQANAQEWLSEEPTELSIESGKPDEAITPPAIETASVPAPEITAPVAAAPEAEPTVSKQLPPLISVNELQPEATETASTMANETTTNNSEVSASEYPVTNEQPYVTEERVATTPSDETPSYPSTNLPPLLR